VSDLLARIQINEHGHRWPILPVGKRPRPTGSRRDAGAATSRRPWEPSPGSSRNNTLRAQPFLFQALSGPRDGLRLLQRSFSICVSGLIRRAGMSSQQKYWRGRSSRKRKTTTARDGLVLDEADCPRVHFGPSDANRISPCPETRRCDRRRGRAGPARSSRPKSEPPITSRNSRSSGRGRRRMIDSAAVDDGGRAR
jgi:hypothetical protein